MFSTRGRSRAACAGSVQSSMPISACTVSPMMRWPPAEPTDSTSLRSRSSTKVGRSEEHTSELQSRQYLVCRLLLEKKNNEDDLYSGAANSITGKVHDCIRSVLVKV